MRSMAAAFAVARVEGKAMDAAYVWIALFGVMSGHVHMLAFTCWETCALAYRLCAILKSPWVRTGRVPFSRDGTESGSALIWEG